MLFEVVVLVFDLLVAEQLLKVKYNAALFVNSRKNVVSGKLGRSFKVLVAEFKELHPQVLEVALL